MVTVDINYEMYVLVILNNVPCHDPCPEFLQPAVTLPWIVFKMETKMQALIKNGTKIKLRDFLIDPVTVPGRGVKG